MNNATEMFEASNGWKVQPGPRHPIRAIYNPDGRDTLDDVLVSPEIVAVVEYAATIGIHAPREKIETNPDAVQFRELEAEALAGMTDEERERFETNGGVIHWKRRRGEPTTYHLGDGSEENPYRLPTIYHETNEDGVVVLDGQMVQAVCQTISQMFGPHFVMTTSGGLRTPGEAGLDTAEWEEFRAWKAERDARLMRERTAGAVEDLLREAQLDDRVEFEKMLREFVQLANAGEIDLGEPEVESDGV